MTAFASCFLLLFFYTLVQFSSVQFILYLVVILSTNSNSIKDGCISFSICSTYLL